MAPQRRLNHLLSNLTPPPPALGTLKLGEITYEVPVSLQPSRLPHSTDLLDIQAPVNQDHLHYLLQKYLLGQDVFLISQPGPYARRLALTFSRLINAEYEYIALHRDVGETELKQGREIRSGGNLVYVDSAAVRAVKHGRLLILEGIEKAERGIMPVLNNLLENREMNLDDGTHIIHPHRYSLLEGTGTSVEEKGKKFIPAHKNFRVIAIAAPVPPYPGYPLDPPFRSRFQARFIDPIGSLSALSHSVEISGPFSTRSLTDKLRDIILSTQYASESRHALESISKTTLPPFPQTALAKLLNLVSKFPPPAKLSPGQLARLFLTIHPALIHASFEAWALLSGQVEQVGLGQLGSPSMSGADEDIGIFGYRLSLIEREGEHTARVYFKSPVGMPDVSMVAAAGPNKLRPFPFKGAVEFHDTTRFLGLLTCFMQAHALGWNISFIPPALPSTASSSTTTLVKVFGQVLGYQTEVVHMYKELGGREFIMRREIENGGATIWKPSPLIEGALAGRLVHFAGIDVIGSTAGSLARFTQDREVELWEGKRIVAEASEEELSSGELHVVHPSFRIICTASKSTPLKDWLSDEHANMFLPIPSQPMGQDEEETILLETKCSPDSVRTLLSFASKYRQSMSTESTQKNRKLGTRTLVRIARRLSLFPGDDDLYDIINQSLLAEFLPMAEKLNLDNLLNDSGITKRATMYNPAPVMQDEAILFPESNNTTHQSSPALIPRFDASQDPQGVASHVPHMDYFYDNSLQTGLMRNLAIDLEILGNHVVLLGNQGVGKNKIVDRLCQLLRRPREYVQLHRDTTVNQLMFNTALEGGIIKYEDSPLLRAIMYGRVIIIDEADKAPEHVVAVFRSLAGQSEMTLSDGRRVCRAREKEGDIVVHPNFRLVLLANRPGYPFLGNHFLQVLGDAFSCHSVCNPDQLSEIRLLSQLAPEMDENLIRRLVGAFQDLRMGYDNGTLAYPYSLRELINLVRHLRAYPNDSLETALRTIFDFDVYRRETIDKLAEILTKHGLEFKHLGLEASRDAAKKSLMDVTFEPKGDTSLDGPKEGEHDPENDVHQGGNRWAGGTGGRDTAGLGGRGSYKRLFSGNPIKQISNRLKDDVPEHIKEKAQEMARQELERRLEDLNMSLAESEIYGRLLTSVQAHIASLYDLLEHLAAKEEERVWVKRQTDGELDDSRLTEGLTGETTVYKRRGMEKPELGRPQIKPKRIRFVFDLSGSMYRFQYDGRLRRCMETAVMLMETLNRLSRKDKYVWDMYGHSGESPSIPLVETGMSTETLRERFKVVEKMNMIPQYAFSGDYTMEAIVNGITEVAKFDADDWFVIAITDANFTPYNITAEDLKRCMNHNPKVNTALVCIGESAEAEWVPKTLPGRAYRVTNPRDIPIVLRSILSTMVDR